MKQIIALFSKNHLFVNLMVVGFFAVAIYCWQDIQKEDMPEVAVDQVYVFTRYNGATPSEVEHFVTKEIEDAIEGIEGIKEIQASSYTGFSRMYIEIDSVLYDPDDVLTDIESAVQGVPLPEEIEDDPVVRIYEANQKPVVEFTVYHEDQHILGVKERQEVQDAVDMLENRLLSLPEVNEYFTSNRQDEKVEIVLDTQKLEMYDLSYSEVRAAITRENLRQPIGIIEDEDNAKVTLNSELDSVEKLQNVIVKSSFAGNLIRLKDVASVLPSFTDETSITKVNGHQGIRVMVRKNTDTGIVEASEVIRKEVDEFFNANYKDSGVNYFLTMDMAESVRNRLDLVGSNGIMGFVIIFLMLFFLLSFKAGFWVGMGIPFSLCFALIGMYLMGYTVNNMTLAGVIVVLGMLVDDAIVIAENITRREEEGEIPALAVVNGTVTMIRPVLASILTTCIAFVPLFFFSGIIGKTIKVIPWVIFLTLGGSFFEALFVLPSHLNSHLPIRVSWFANRKNRGRAGRERKHWFNKVEGGYQKILEKMLRFRWLIFVLFILGAVGAGFLGLSKFSFELFPREQATEMFLFGSDSNSADKYETELRVRELEVAIKEACGPNLDYFETRIGANRRGLSANANFFTFKIVLLEQNKAVNSVAEVEAAVNKAIEPFKAQFDQMRLMQQRFQMGGGDGESALLIEVLENDDAKREEIAKELVAIMSEHEAIDNAEYDEPVLSNQYTLSLDNELVSRLGVNSTEITSSLRTIVSGTTLFYHYRDEIEIPVNLTIDASKKSDMQTILNESISNTRGYLIPLKNLVEVKQEKASEYIERVDGKRIMRVYGDLKKGADISPLEFASWMEENVFPDVLSKYKTARLSWGGEVEDTRESGDDFQIAMITVLVLIYIVLLLLFKSPIKPIIIMVSIPFAVVGVIYIYFAHGITAVGAFTVVGILGLAGVVVNDSIVMLSTLQEEASHATDNESLIVRVAKVASTRLRAVLLTTVTTVAGLMPTAYGVLGYDSMLSDMMLAMSWGLIFGTLVTLVLVPLIFYSVRRFEISFGKALGKIGIEWIHEEVIHDDIAINAPLVEKKKPEGENL